MDYGIPMPIEGRTTNMFTQKKSRAIERTIEWTAPAYRVGLAVVLIAVLSACSFAPGMRMVKPATLPETSTADGDPATEVQYPITPIDLTLIRQMHSATAQVHNAEVKGLYAVPGAYKLGPGDVLQITVWDHPELAAALGQPAASTRPSDASPGFVVDHEGNVDFPYVGNVHVGGQSADQVQKKIAQGLSRVFVSPQVTVRVASYRASQVYIDGEVRAPGAQTINDIPMTLTEAINRAGGFAPNADQSRVVLIRDGVSYPVSVSDMIDSGVNPARIMLANGDMLRVLSREDNAVYVMGEVNKPATVLPTRNGTLTLSDALSQAGSMNPATADAKQLYVIRDAGNLKPQIYHLDATSPVAMVLANQFELQPRDVVYLDNNSLVRFSRVLNLLLPLISAGLTGAVVGK
jgi:polysaccharide export outer membrane protein